MHNMCVAFCLLQRNKVQLLVSFLHLAMFGVVDGVRQEHALPLWWEKAETHTHTLPMHICGMMLHIAR